MSKSLFLKFLSGSAGSVGLFGTSASGYYYVFRNDKVIKKAKDVVDRGPVVTHRGAKENWSYSRKFFPSNLIVFCSGKGNDPKAKENCNRFLETKQKSNNRLQLFTWPGFQMKSGWKKYKFTYKNILEEEKGVKIREYYTECPAGNPESPSNPCATQYIYDGWTKQLVS